MKEFTPLFPHFLLSFHFDSNGLVYSWGRNLLTAQEWEAQKLSQEAVENKKEADKSREGTSTGACVADPFFSFVFFSFVRLFVSQFVRSFVCFTVSLPACPASE